MDDRRPANIPLSRFPGRGAWAGQTRAQSLIQEIKKSESGSPSSSTSSSPENTLRDIRLDVTPEGDEAESDSPTSAVREAEENEAAAPPETERDPPARELPRSIRIHDKQGENLLPGSAPLESPFSVRTLPI